MERAASRSARLIRMQHLLYHSSRGLTTAELAAALGVSPRTVQRDLRTLEADMSVPLTQDRRRYGITGSYILPPINFTLQEARALLLAARLFLRYSDEADPHGIAALQRLAGALPPPVAEHILATVEALRGKPCRQQFVRVMETITSAWAKQQLLRLHYYSRRRPETHAAEVEPYLLEASAPGYSTYLVGYSRTHGQVRTFKVERILQAQALEEQFSPRREVDVVAGLNRSWGIIWGGEDDEEEIELRFSAAVSKRVQEAIWHPSQRLVSLPDGGCRLILRVPSLVEVLPWIRSWGPDVEVLRPGSLRQLLSREAAKAVEIYQGAEPA